ncbi:MAG: phosphogluconate dehydrogenase C-terminal domain-containing protein [Atribacterota bacterium]
MEKVQSITILGAAGKMGKRIVEKLQPQGYTLFYCEKGERGLAALREQGLKPSSPEEAIPESDLVIMAVPDRVLEAVSQEIVPLMRRDSIMVCLDATVPYFGKIARREDCTFVATHPCHPPLFAEEETEAARRDFFGGIAKQDIVIALISGTEENLQAAQKVCEEMFTPVRKTYRITLEQMALLEPGIAEVVAVPAVVLVKEALEEVVKRGLPYEAALAFMLGHLRIDLAVVFGGANIEFSDACKVALKHGYEALIRPDWRKVLDKENLQAIAREMIEKS